MAPPDASASAAEAAQSASGGKRLRFRVQLVVFIALAVGYTIFFQRHLQVYVSETLLIGGTLSLLGLWKLIWDAIGTAGRGRPDDLLRRALESPNAPEYLAFATLLLLVLLATTSSIYLSYEGDGGGQPFTVEIWQAGKMLLPPQTLNPYDHTKGQPFFLNKSSADVEFRITSPTGYRPLKEPNHLWSAHRVEVPASFDKKALQLLRVIPGAALLSSLPDRADDPGRGYELRILTPAGQVVVPHYVKTVVYTGMTTEDLSTESDSDQHTALRQAIDDYLAGLHFPADQRTPMAVKLSANPMLAASAELKAASVVTFQIYARDAPDGGAAPATAPKESPIMSVSYTIPTDGARVHSVILESH